MVEFPRDEKIQQTFYLEKKRKKKEHIARWKGKLSLWTLWKSFGNAQKTRGFYKIGNWGYFQRALIDLSSPSQVAQEPDSLKDFMWEPTEVDLFHLD